MKYGCLHYNGGGDEVFVVQEGVIFIVRLTRTGARHRIH